MAEEQRTTTGKPSIPPGWRRASTPWQLDFPPVRNGIDYLVSVVEHLDEYSAVVLPRDVKYAVLHLQAAAEVLLKARLLEAHWSLVFREPGKATLEKYQKADFDSCSTDDTVKRLRNIAGVAIEEKDADALKALAKDRNALQHFGLAKEVPVVESRAGEVLDFLVRFLDGEILPNLKPEERRQAEVDLDRVRDGLTNIAAYVRKRMERLKPEVAEAVECPECGQRALLLDPDATRCAFCGLDWSADDQLERFLEDRTLHSVTLCPHCGTDSLVDNVEFADSSPHTMLYCFGCGSRFAPSQVLRCTDCGLPMLVGDDEPTPRHCADCRDHAAAEALAAEPDTPATESETDR
ncbi:hypothetical protein [Streptomyces aculeolatus]|uniref:hypothetical protein n=1 Tax=Streptomyces aculeolatus TaxID=270689 RepID=UPI001CEC1FFB|nr:hypothetical protein [Streptomyces aculeolatus]